MRSAPELKGWESQWDPDGFFIYTSEDFSGCIRLNLVDGTTEVFLDKSPALGLSEEAIFTEPGYPSYDGEEQLVRAKLFVEARPTTMVTERSLANATEAATSLGLEEVPGKWIQALEAGWIITSTPCMCGGSWAWLQPRPSGAHEMFGCVCHHEPGLCSHDNESYYPSEHNVYCSDCGEFVVYAEERETKDGQHVWLKKDGTPQRVPLPE